MDCTRICVAHYCMMHLRCVVAQVQKARLRILPFDGSRSTLRSTLKTLLAAAAAAQTCDTLAAASSVDSDTMEAQMQTLQQQLAMLATQMAEMQAAQLQQAAGTPVGQTPPPQQPPPPPPQPPQPPPLGVGIDTRLLGRPDTFEKEEKWRDWAVIMRAYGGLLGTLVGPGMEAAERGEGVLLNELDSSDKQQASRQLHFALTLLCRGEALSIVQNSGPGEGFQAWKRLNTRYEPNNRTRVAGALLAILRFNFQGDIQAKLELFERSINEWQHKAKETISDNLRIGILLNCLEDGSSLKEHLILNSNRFNTWTELKDEVINIRRTQVAFKGPDDMDVGALSGKGAGTQSTCKNCGRKGHTQKDCRSKGGGAYVPPPAPSGAARPDTGKGAKGGKGKSGGKKFLSSSTCHTCGGKGHFAKECPSRIHSVDEAEAGAEQPEEEQTQHAAAEDGQGSVHGLWLGSLDADDGDGGPGWLCTIDMDDSAAARLPQSAAPIDAISKAESVTIGVDSCAAVSVMPKGRCGQFPVKQDAQTGATYRSANGGAIKDLGQQIVFGDFGGGQVRGARFRVADVSRPLMSIADMLDAGHRVVFDRKDGTNVSYAEYKATGQKIPVKEHRRTFELTMNLADRPAVGFPRQG